MQGGTRSTYDGPYTLDIARKSSEQQSLSRAISDGEKSEKGKKMSIQQPHQRPAWHQNTSITKAIRLFWVSIASLVLAGIFQHLKGMNHLSFLSWLEYLFTFAFLSTDSIGLLLLVKGLSQYRRERKHTQQ